MPNSAEYICKKDGCTLADTGICMFNNSPAVCPERLASLNDVDKTVSSNSTIAGPVLEAPEEAGKFLSSYTIPPQKASEMWRRRDCKTIGILGIPNTGKTAFLVSLYLLISGNKLPNLRFRNSSSLMAFEEIARGARKWKEGEPPDQMTMHTEIKDERTAGFLHLKLFSSTHNRTLQLLFPDLPGEWTNTLISNNRVDRLSFLRNASTIWIMVNGQDIANANSKMNTIDRIEILIDRVAEFLGSDVPHIEIVVTHRDKSGPVREKLSTLLDEYGRKGISIGLSETAAFAEPGSGLEAGHGIENLILQLFNVTPSNPVEFWPASLHSQNARSFMNIRPRI